MLRENNVRWTVLICANALLWCVLGFHQSTTAAPKSNEPFANAVSQRAEIISQLKEIAAEAKAQHALMQSGTMKVIVSK